LNKRLPKSINARIQKKNMNMIISEVDNMEINTRNFGKIEIDENGIIEFPQGLPGFENTRKYVLLGQATEANPFQWLQSVDCPDVAFVVTDPFSIMNEYIIDVDDSEVQEIDVKDTDKILSLVIVVVPSDMTKMSANLRAPILINTENKKGKQVMLNNDAYQIKYYLMERKNVVTGGQD